MTSSSLKFIVLLLVFSFFTISAVSKQDSILKKDEIWKCVRWTWTSQEQKTVTCLEWIKEDCSKRLYKEICKGSKK